MEISKESILAKRVDLLHRQATAAILGMVFIAISVCLLIYILARPEDTLVSFMATWLASLIILSSLRLYSVSLYHKQPALLKANQWLYFYVFWMAVSGVLWNVLLYEIHLTLEPVFAYFLVVTMAGITVGAVAAYNTSFLAFTVMIVSTLVPATLIGLMSSDEVMRVLAVMLFAYIIFLLIVSFRLCNQIHHLIFNEFMITRLENEKSYAAIINEELETEIRHRIETEGKLKEEKDKAEALADTLMTISSKDGLTGLNNRRRFDEFLAMEWNRCLRGKEPLSLIFCDIDCYKSFNDNYGHLAGDDCLKKIANVLEHFTRRSSDFAARYGGEEFAIILPNTPRDMAYKLAEQMRLAVEDLKVLHQSSTVSRYVTISLGVVTLIPESDIDTNELINLADQALYEAKARGRNQTVISNGTA